MKKVTLIAAGLSMSLLGHTQIPNAGFETWVSETETATHFFVPQHWVSSDELIYAFDAGYAGASVTQTAASHSGSFAAMMQVVANHGDTVNGVLYSCDSLVQLIRYSFSGKICGFPCTIRPQYLQAYYKFNGVGGDSAAFYIYMTKWNGVKRDTIVYTQYENNTNVGAYTIVNVLLMYKNNLEYPDTALIGVGIRAKNGGTAHIGSTMSADDLAFTGSVGLGINNLAAVSSNVVLYPNPFDNNATLGIPQSIKLNNAAVEIYNVLGQNVRTIQNITENNVSIEKGNLQNGIYFYQLINSGEIINSGKFIIQ
jgi:hypothetical protein